MEAYLALIKVNRARMLNVGEKELSCWSLFSPSRIFRCSQHTLWFSVLIVWKVEDPNKNTFLAMEHYWTICLLEPFSKPCTRDCCSLKEDSTCINQCQIAVLAERPNNLKGMKYSDSFFVPQAFTHQFLFCAKFKRNQLFELYGSAWFSQGRTLNHD